MIVLDTHVLAWAASDERKLGRKAKTLINRLWEKGNVAVCAMTFWEIALLQSRAAGAASPAVRNAHVLQRTVG